MSNKRELGKKVTDLFKQYQNTEPFNAIAEHDKTQLAIINLTQALRGVVSEEDVIRAVGDAKSANGVSRAARNRLPPLS